MWNRCWSPQSEPFSPITARLGRSLLTCMRRLLPMRAKPSVRIRRKADKRWCSGTTPSSKRMRSMVLLRFCCADAFQSADVHVHELPAETFAATVHHGSYQTIGEAHEAILKWIEANG